jgi:hypothetical protein
MDQETIQIVPEIDLMAEARQLRVKIDGALKKEMEESAQQSMLGLFLSIGGFFTLGGILYMMVAYVLLRTEIYTTGKLPFGLFFLVYIIVFAGLVVLSDHYQPKKQYYTGKTFAGQMVDDPFTVQDNMDRQHIALGLLLVIPNFFRMNMKNLLDYWNNKSPVTNSTLAAAILIFIKDQKCSAEIFEALGELRFGGPAISQTLGYLRLINWVETKQEDGRTYVCWTEKVKDLLHY